MKEKSEEKKKYLVLFLVYPIPRPNIIVQRNIVMMPVIKVIGIKKEVQIILFLAVIAHEVVGRLGGRRRGRGCAICVHEDLLK